MGINKIISSTNSTITVITITCRSSVFICSIRRNHIYEPPDGVESPPGMVFRLIKSLYGLPQSGRNWNSHLHETLLAVTFARLQEDTCLYSRKQDNDITILAVYVDDLYIAASNTQILDTLIEWLQTVYKIKILGIPKQLLEVRITWNPPFDK